MTTGDDGQPHRPIQVGVETDAPIKQIQWQGVPFEGQHLNAFGMVKRVVPQRSRWENFEINIADSITWDGNGYLIEAQRFFNCRLVGPAILVPVDHEAFGSNLTGRRLNFWDSLESVLWPLDDDPMQRPGAIKIAACEFERCSFVGVGIATPRDQLEEWMALLDPNPDPVNPDPPTPSQLRELDRDR